MYKLDYSNQLKTWIIYDNNNNLRFKAKDNTNLIDFVNSAVKVIENECFKNKTAFNPLKDFRCSESAALLMSMDLKTTSTDLSVNILNQWAKEFGI